MLYIYLFKSKLVLSIPLKQLSMTWNSMALSNKLSSTYVIKPGSFLNSSAYSLHRNSENKLIINHDTNAFTLGTKHDQFCCSVMTQIIGAHKQWEKENNWKVKVLKAQKDKVQHIANTIGNLNAHADNRHSFRCSWVWLNNSYVQYHKSANSKGKM